MRISLAGGKLYMTNADAVTEDKHLNPENANVRCPNR